MLRGRSKFLLILFFSVFERISWFYFKSNCHNFLSVMYWDLSLTTYCHSPLFFTCWCQIEVQWKSTCASNYHSRSVESMIEMWWSWLQRKNYLYPEVVHVTILVYIFLLQWLPCTLPSMPKLSLAWQTGKVHLLMIASVEGGSFWAGVNFSSSFLGAILYSLYFGDYVSLFLSDFDPFVQYAVSFL